MMIVVVSPAKKLDFETPAPVEESSTPKFSDKAYELIKELSKLNTEEVGKLMSLSEKLADLNVNRYKSFKKTENKKHSKQAMYAFKGDTYVGLEAETFSKCDIKYAQNHLKILSGLYGVLSPLDLIQPYRLEMGTRFGIQGKKNLYQFWGEQITEELNKQAGKKGYIVNCASKEYFSAVKPQNLNAQIIETEFKVKKGDSYKVVGIHAKKARGAMAQFIIKNKVTTPEGLKKFNSLDFSFNPKLSTDTTLTFTRD